MIRAFRARSKFYHKGSEAMENTRRPQQKSIDNCIQFKNAKSAKSGKDVKNVQKRQPHLEMGWQQL